MISVLIPVYNFSIQPLIEKLLSQFENVESKWEILLSDDASNIEFRNLNSEFLNKINYKQVKLFQQEINIGNAVNRNYLIKQAKYGWLLFLDADVLPVHHNFLSIYVNSMKSTSQEIIIGNIIYNIKNPLPHLLRWKYGIEKEQIAFEIRKNKPILNSRGANFAIKRNLAKKMDFPILKEKYGFVDTRFFLQFKQHQICVIENPVYHLGIEENRIFLDKTKKAIANALFLLNNNDEFAMQISLVSNYKRIRIFKRILAEIYSKFHIYLENKLVSKKPSIIIFQVYKILYVSYLDVFKNT